MENAKNTQSWFRLFLQLESRRENISCTHRLYLYIYLNRTQIFKELDRKLISRSLSGYQLSS